MAEDSKKQGLNPLLILVGVLPLVTTIFVAGVAWGRGEANDQKYEAEHEAIHETIRHYHEFAVDEVNGLRSDMVKEDAHIWEAIEELK